MALCGELVETPLREAASQTIGGGSASSASGGSTSSASSAPPNSCDVDGVSVGYSPTFVASRTAPGYRVAAASIRDLSNTCSGAQLTVTLSDGVRNLTSATVVATGAATQTVSFASTPLASQVASVAVQLSGGTLPIPAQCKNQSFDNVRTGTTGNDVLQGTNQRDLIFTEGGDDTVQSLEGNDCVSAGRGTDKVTAGNGNDVIVFAAGVPAGKTQVMAGNGDNLIQLGDGGSTVTVGNGANQITGGAGNDTLTLGNGANRVDGGLGVNTCYVPQQALKKMTIKNCTVKLT